MDKLNDQLKALGEELKAADAQERHVRQSAMSRRWFVRNLAVVAGAVVLGSIQKLKADEGCGTNTHGCSGENTCSTNLCSPGNTCNPNTCSSGNECNTNKCYSQNQCNATNECITANYANCGSGDACSAGNSCGTNQCDAKDFCIMNTCDSNQCAQDTCTTNTCNVNDTCSSDNKCGSLNFGCTSGNASCTFDIGIL